MDNIQLYRLLRGEGYTDLRLLRDGKWVGVLPMIYTFRVNVDLTEHGHGGGVDFETYTEAQYFANTMQRIDDWPPVGGLADKRKLRPGAEHPDPMEEFLYAQE